MYTLKAFYFASNRSFIILETKSLQILLLVHVLPLLLQVRFLKNMNVPLEVS